MCLYYENCSLMSILFQTLNNTQATKNSLRNFWTLKVKVVGAIQLVKTKNQCFQLCLDWTCNLVLSTHYFASSAQKEICSPLICLLALYRCVKTTHLVGHKTRHNCNIKLPQNPLIALMKIHPTILHDSSCLSRNITQNAQSFVANILLKNDKQLLQSIFFYQFQRTAEQQGIREMKKHWFYLASIYLINFLAKVRYTCILSFRNMLLTDLQPLLP